MPVRCENSHRAQVHAHARQHDLIYPVSLASEGTATIGGTLATNAGGNLTIISANGLNVDNSNYWNITGAGTLPITFTRAVSNWFNEKRGLALGVALIGTGISGAMVKIYAGWLIFDPYV